MASSLTSTESSNENHCCHFQKVDVDILELSITSCGKRYVVVAQDYFCKYVSLYAMPDQSFV